MKKFTEEIGKSTGIKVNLKDLERILASLILTPHFWRVVYLSNQPFNVVAEAIKLFQQEGLVQVNEARQIFLTPAGQKIVEEKNIKPRISHTCSKCQGRGITLEKLGELAIEFREISQSRPPAIIDYDQGYVTNETTLSRIALLADRGDIQGKEIIILGDDDLVSIAAALSGLPKRVVTLEVDERLISFINEVAKKKGLPIETRCHNLLNKLPDEYVGSFDTFLTDPPETVEAFKLFITRGLAALKGPGCAGYFGLTYVESSLEKWRVFQQILTEEFRLTITDLIHDFNEYVNWDYLLPSIRDDLPFIQIEPDFNWYRSSQYRILTTESYQPLNIDFPEEDIYVDQDALVFTKRRS